MEVESDPKTPDIFTEFAPHFQLSPGLPLNDDDDNDSIRDEIQQLSVFQKELQKELQAVINVVEIVQYDQESEDLEYKANSLRSLGSSRGSLGLSDDEILRQTSSLESEIEEETKEPRKRQRRMSFSAAFFKLAAPAQKLTLEQQKEKQKSLIQENLAILHPGLEDVLEIHQDMQDEILNDATKSFPRMEEMVQKRQTSLDEEKKKQMEMLSVKLQEIDPELMEQMQNVQVSQAEYVEQKKQEIRNSVKKVKKKSGKLTQTKSTKQFWNEAMSRLGHMVNKTRRTKETNGLSEEEEA